MGGTKVKTFFSTLLCQMNRMDNLLLPQSKNSHDLLNKLKDFNLPKEAIELLLQITIND